MGKARPIPVMVCGAILCLWHGCHIPRVAGDRQLAMDTRMQLPIKMLAGIRPRLVSVVESGWDRGYRPIRWSYELPLPLQEAARDAAKEMPFVPFQPGSAVDPDKLTENCTLQRTVNGVRQTVAISRGVRGAAVSLMVTESVAAEGPLPSNWPDKAVPAPDYPLPWSGLRGTLASARWEPSPAAGGVQYWFTCVVKKPVETVVAGIKDTGGNSGYKPRRIGSRVSMRSQSRGPYVWIDVKPGKPDDAKREGWSTVEFSVARTEQRGKAPVLLR